MQQGTLSLVSGFGGPALIQSVDTLARPDDDYHRPPKLAQESCGSWIRGTWRLEVDPELSVGPSSGVMLLEVYASPNVLVLCARKPTCPVSGPTRTYSADDVPHDGL